jgi:3-oxoacyl-[acyl-carrier protein] reductase
MKDEWEEVIGVNLTGTYRVTQAVISGMSRARQGRVVTIGSVVGTIGSPGQANYAAAKAGLVGMTKSLAKEYSSRGIKLNVVAPGYVDTDMTQALPEERLRAILSEIPLGRPYTPQEIADCVRRTLLSEQTGQVIAIDGGLT